MTEPRPYTHVEATTADLPEGIYRVVGRDEETVTLLHVADATERRIHTGTVVTVSRDAFDRFPPASNPDGNRPARAGLASNLATSYWSLRAFARELASNWLATALVVALLCAGTVGDRVVSLPDPLFDGAFLLGAIGLVLVGSGRYRSFV